LRSITAGGDLACGVEVQTGLGYCWGSNKFGQLGDGTTIDRLVPTLVGGGHVRFSRIDAGVEDACGIEAQSGLGYCWGSNRVGQLGDGTTVDRLVPTLVGGGNRRFRSIEPWWEGVRDRGRHECRLLLGRNHLATR
jgi:alpha-tubulin suppressor-like RCC1 family protein